jgi:hypothetical protein
MDYDAVSNDSFSLSQSSTCSAEGLLLAVTNDMMRTSVSAESTSWFHLKNNSTENPR